MNRLKNASIAICLAVSAINVFATELCEKTWTESSKDGLHSLTGWVCPARGHRGTQMEIRYGTDQVIYPMPALRWSTYETAPLAHPQGVFLFMMRDNSDLL